MTAQQDRPLVMDFNWEEWGYILAHLAKEESAHQDTPLAEGIDLDSAGESEDARDSLRDRGMLRLNADGSPRFLRTFGLLMLAMINTPQTLRAGTGQARVYTWDAEIKAALLLEGNLVRLAVFPDKQQLQEYLAASYPMSVPTRS